MHTLCISFFIHFMFPFITYLSLIFHSTPIINRYNLTQLEGKMHFTFNQNTKIASKNSSQTHRTQTNRISLKIRPKSGVIKIALQYASRIL